MKFYLLIFILLLGYSNANACSCASSWQETNNHYITSDFVGKVTINQVFDSPTKESKTFKIEVKAEKVFKGNEVSTLYVYGNRGHGILTSCDLYVEKGEDWIVYATKNNEGKLTFGWCSNSKPMVKPWFKGRAKQNRQQAINRELEMLDFLSSRLPSLKRNFSVQPVGTNISDYLKKYDGIELPQNSYYQYLITFDRNLKIHSVKTLKGIDNEFDAGFIDFLKNKVEWVVPYSDKPKTNFQHVFAVFYYYDKGDETRFLSSFEL
ncbi:hypothetical protein GYB29_01325 [bacterium]|nr:hypothetical protein [bacterium]